MKKQAFFSILIPVSIAIPLLIVLNGCDISPPTQAEEPNLKELQSQLTAKYAQIKAIQPPNVPPSLIMVSIDQSGSINQARIAKINIEDFQPIFESLAQTGGTLAVSMICDQSDRPLTRVTLDPLPPLIVKIPENPPERPDTSRGNPYKHQKRLKAYRQEAQQYQETLNTTEQQLTTYEQELNQKLSENRQKIEKIKPQIQDILKHPRNCQETDIQNAIQRANLFFSEPQPNNWKKPRKYALFITDGLDSFSQQPAQIQADQVLLVNGSNEIGIFKGITHQRFESPSYALTRLSQWIKQE